MDAFSRLCERVRHGIVHDLGWRELRAVQEEAIHAILDGCNVVILAPTAGGKTEAAALPVVDVLCRTGGRALYLSPLRALLNNQETRMEQLARLGGLRAFKWHGDVGADRKRAFAADPAEILMLTPESLEVILATPRYDKEALFGPLRFVIVDEIHAFAGDDRGDHLVALMERLTEFATQDFQRLGLSATVGDPEVLLEWLQGSSRRPGRVLRPPEAKSSRVLEIHPLGPDEEPGPVAARLARGLKSLLFTESRGKVERLKTQLEEGGIRAFPHHASLSRAFREEAERAFRESANCCIVCTSTMELGLDVGDLDLVMQLHAPATVSGFLQRLGRTGRRPGTRGRMAFLTDEDDSFLQACALVTLALEGWVESVGPSRRSVAVYLHQVLARVLQCSGLTRRALVEGVGRPWCLTDLGSGDREEVLDHLLELGILDRAGSVLVLGTEGEKRFGRANFRDLYSVFETLQELKVRTVDNQEVGGLDSWFARSMGEHPVFVLAGRAWEAVECDWQRGLLTVRPAPRGKLPTWMGSPRLLSREVAGAMRSVLVGTGPLAFLGPGGSKCLERLRLEWGELLRPTPLVLQRRGDEVLVFTFAGGRINNVLGKLFEHRFGGSASIDNVHVKVGLPAEGPWWGQVEAVLMEASAGLDPEVLGELVARMPRGTPVQVSALPAAPIGAGVPGRATTGPGGAAEVAARGRWRSVTAASP